MEVEKRKGEPFDPGPTRADGMHLRYKVLPEEDRAKGFVRPVRYTYVHIACGMVTRINSLAIAETLARDPSYYSGGYCVNCRAHFPNCEFVWEGTNEIVGS